MSFIGVRYRRRSYSGFIGGGPLDLQVAVIGMESFGRHCWSCRMVDLLPKVELVGGFLCSGCLHFLGSEVWGFDLGCRCVEFGGACRFTELQGHPAGER